MTATSFVSGSSTYGPTSATVNGPLTCLGGSLGAPSGYSALTMVGTQLVFYSPAAVPVALISSSGNAQFSGQLQCNAGVISGPAFTIVPASTSGYTFRNNANTTSPMIVTDTGALTILGAATKPGGGAWTAASDRRLKRNIEPHAAGLAQLLALRPVAYEYNGRGGIPDTGIRHVGLIAQEAQPIIPRAIGHRRTKLDPSDEYETDVLTVDASELLYTMINAVRELSAEIETLKAALQPAAEPAAPPAANGKRKRKAIVRGDA